MLDRRRPEPGTVYLIDDDELDRRYTSRAIKKLFPHADVVEIQNGQEGIAAIQDGAPDLILLDLHMPGVNGFEFLEKIKNAADFRRIPIVVISTSDSQRDICNALDRHANAYLKKPATPSDYSVMAERICAFWLDLALTGRHLRN